MKGKPLHALKFFLHITCKAKEKKGCVHHNLNAQTHKNDKYHKKKWQSSKLIKLACMDALDQIPY